MVHKGFIINGQEIDHNTAIEMAERGELDYPVEYLKSLRHRDTETPSPSGLGYCLRKLQLQQANDYYTRPESGNMSLMGTGAHMLLESNTEKRNQGNYLSTEFHFPDLIPPYDRVTFGGTPDHINALEGYVLDHKSKGYLPVKNGKPCLETPEAHRIQCNAYAWLAYKCYGVKLKEYRLFYFDGKNTQMNRHEVADLDVIEQWIKDRVYLWAKASSEGRLLPILPTYPNTGLCGYCEVQKFCIKAEENSNND